MYYFNVYLNVLLQCVLQLLENPPEPHREGSVWGMTHTTAIAICALGPLNLSKIAPLNDVSLLEHPWVKLFLKGRRTPEGITISSIAIIQRTNERATRTVGGGYRIGVRLRVLKFVK